MADAMHDTTMMRTASEIISPSWKQQIKQLMQEVRRIIDNLQSSEEPAKFLKKFLQLDSSSYEDGSFTSFHFHCQFYELELQSATAKFHFHSNPRVGVGK
jgi:hypothetical protein